MFTSQVEKVVNNSTPPNKCQVNDVILKEEELVIHRQNTRDPLNVEKLRIRNFPPPNAQKKILNTNPYSIPTLHKRSCTYNVSLQSSVMYGKKKPLRIEHHHIERHLGQKRINHISAERQEYELEIPVIFRILNWSL